MTATHPHFVSASAGELCAMCRNAPSTHKVGEEIPHDEPCMSCGSSWRYFQDTDDQGSRIMGLPKNDCRSVYHLSGIGGPHGQRHNLTAYVCCTCFRRILGPAVACPLPVSEPVPCNHAWVRYVLDDSAASHRQRDNIDADDRPYRDLPMSPREAFTYAATIGSTFATRVVAMSCRDCGVKIEREDCP